MRRWLKPIRMPERPYREPIKSLFASPNSADKLPKPRMVGRVVRLALGVLLLFLFTRLVSMIPSQGRQFLAARTGWSVPGGGWWVAAAICFLALPIVINSGFGRHWRSWPRIAFLALAGGAALWDWLAYGGFWAPPLAVLIFLLVAYVFAHAGISYVVSAFAATPG